MSCARRNRQLSKVLGVAYFSLKLSQSHSSMAYWFMLPFKSRDLETQNLASRSPTVQAELEALAQLSFSFEMDGFHGQGTSNPHSHNTQGSRSRSASTTPSLNTNIQDTTELDQLIAAAGLLPHHMFPPHSYSSTLPPMSDPRAHLNLHDAGFAHGQTSHMQLPQFSSTDLDWLQQALNQEHHAQGSTSGTGAPSSSPSPTVDNHTEGDLALNNDEKRRRNTAASARFRIKKKQNTVNLERSISDLTGRAGDLEREAADLRRENGWLKEIVMLKNARFPPVNHMSETGQRSDAGPSRNRSGRQNDVGSLSDSDKQSSDSERSQAKAGKGGRKGKTKGRGDGK